ncbi:MAG: MOSC domain-containing protein [Bacillota bacterium]
MTVRYVSVGRPAPLAGTQVLSAIQKQPLDGPVHLGRLGLEGDQQADLEHHGGPDKAVCVYAYDHYPFWEQELGRTLGPSAFGENLTVEGLPEAAVHIGDIYRLGSALVQVAQPRVPCYKIDRKFGINGVTERIVANGLSGYYLRVLEEGRVQAGDPMVLLERDAQAATVLQANQVFHHRRQDREAMEWLLSATPAIAQVWKDVMKRRIAAL